MNKDDIPLLVLLGSVLLLIVILAPVTIISENNRCDDLQEAYPEYTFRHGPLGRCEVEIGEDIWLITRDEALGLMPKEKR